MERVRILLIPSGKFGNLYRLPAKNGAYTGRFPPSFVPIFAIRETKPMLVSPEIVAAGTAATLLGYSSWIVAETLWESWRNLQQARLSQFSHATATAAKIEQARLAGVLKSPYNASTGWRQMVIAEIVDESSDCRSFYLVDAAGEPLPSFLPGQHLLVQLPSDKHGRKPLRCYSLSDAPDPRYYRLTIKRVPIPESDIDRTKNGLSDYLHSTLREGDSILIKGPQGHFHVDPNFSGPLVLLALGVGITPMISILRWSLKAHPGRKIYLFYQVRNSEQHPFASFLNKWRTERNELKATTFYSRPEAHEMQGIHFDDTGRFDTARLRTMLPAARSKFYLCGPADWMLDFEKQLIQVGVQPEDIAWESFGDIKSTVNPQPETVDRTSQAVNRATVSFKRSKKSIPWSNNYKSLLDLAEDNDIVVESGCRSGVCGACVVKNLCGKVKYSKESSASTAAGEILTCISLPEGNVELDL